MPPILGIGLLVFAGLCVGGVCVLPLVVVLCVPRWRVRLSSWVLAGIPTFAVLGVGLVLVGANRGDAALAEAVGRGDVSEVRRLLGSGVSADARVDPSDLYGSPTVVHRAIDERRWDVVRLLIEHGATDSYYGDDAVYEQSAVGRLDEAGQKELAQRLRKNGPAHF